MLRGVTAIIHRLEWIRGRRIVQGHPWRVWHVNVLDRVLLWSPQGGSISGVDTNNSGQIFNRLFQLIQPEINFARTGLCASPARFFFHIVECSLEIDARSFHRVPLGSLEDFRFCAGYSVVIGHDILAIGDDGFRGGAECRGFP